MKIGIFGATSAIAIETARRFARDGASFFLVARNGARLEEVAADLRVRGAAHVATRVVDLDERDAHAALVREADSALGGMETALIAYGTLPDQKSCEENFDAARRALTTNFLGPISLLTHLANLMEPRRAGVIVAITSVAGDRGRKKNYVYGSAKGGLALFLQGLRNRLADSGVAVLTVKPGFVATPMTAHLPRGPLFASARSVGCGIHRAILARTDVVYLPSFWRPIMFVIRAIPERWFKRMNL